MLYQYVHSLYKIILPIWFFPSPPINKISAILLTEIKQEKNVSSFLVYVLEQYLDMKEPMKIFHWEQTASHCITSQIKYNNKTLKIAIFS